ncbi:MAG: hypothetical protein JST92_22370 [Deltaproteobacteria bacterium]|nr:hypothetical protein [Deltaproteobacteria bacterium]
MRAHTSRSLVSIAVLAAPLLVGWSSCETSLTRDPSFDLWCGANLCAWTTDRGAVARVPTWHEDDSGVSLVGSDVRISQLVTETGLQTPQCLAFEMITDIDDGANVTLALDFGDDGVLDFTAPVPATHWQAVTFSITPPRWFPNVRFILSKAGAGRAVLSELRVTTGSNCTGAPPEQLDRPLVAPCESDAQCSSHICGPAVFPYQGASTSPLTSCGACHDDHDCDANHACGVGSTALGMYATCVPRAQSALGDRCVDNADCGSGICCFSMCSACCSDSACTGGDTCQAIAAPGSNYAWLIVPSICGPEKGHTASGASCFHDSDCASGTCDGSGDFAVCWFDGRRCATDADCPGESLDPQGKVAACVHAGKDKGHCR